MRKLTRRSFTASATMMPAFLPATAPQTLRGMAAAKHILFGCMVTQADMVDPAFARLVAEQCAMIAPGNEAKWPCTEPQEGQFTFAPLDALAGFAAATQLQLQMHNLVWANGLPRWTLDALRQGRGREIMARHIRTVAARYRGRVQSWIVVNEAVDPEWTSDRFGLVMTPWWHGLGDEFVADAFADAAAADPAARLTINDDNLEYATPLSQQKRAMYVRLIEYWLRSGVPIQAFGLQAHLKPWLPFAGKQYRDFLRQLAGFGLTLAITEFDVNDRAFPPGTTERDLAVAAATKNFLDVALDEPALDTLVLWGFSDRSTWLRKEPGAQRADGLPLRPLPYDAHLAAKPMREAIASALKHTRARPP